MGYVRFALIAAVGLLAASVSHAGLADPVPGPFTKHVFSIPGIVNDGLVTVITCTSATTSALNVGVEWFRKNGTSLGVSSLNIPAGETRSFATATVTWLPADALMPLGEELKSGAARVLSTTSKGLLCNAFAIDPIAAIPDKMMQLLVTGPTKQKGQ